LESLQNHVGIVIFYSFLNAGDNEIDLTPFSAGVYFISQKGSMTSRFVSCDFRKKVKLQLGVGRIYIFDNR
jgi:hypothetical protein